MRAGFTLQDMEEALAERSRLQDTTQKSAPPRCARRQQRLGRRHCTLCLELC